MTIKDIADLAGVSISTVSKIINGKDESIGSKTREKVLQIVKQYHYSPYSSTVAPNTQKSFLIGVIISESRNAPEFISVLNQLASNNGYCIILCQHHDSKEEEVKAINSLCMQKVDGVIWQRASEDSYLLGERFKERQIPVYTIDYFTKKLMPNCHINYSSLGYFTTKYMIDNNHKKIACIYSNKDLEVEKFVSGYKKALYENQIDFEDSYVKNIDSQTIIDCTFFFNVTAIVCYNEQIAANIYRQASEYGYKIPKDISVIGVGRAETASLMIPPLTVVDKNYEQLATYTLKKLLQKIEKKTVVDMVYEDQFQIISGDSVTAPLNEKAKKIIVVGSINKDIFIDVVEPPEMGKTVLAHSCVTFPGGKGANQAIGCARLGADVHLIGRIGNDYDGQMLRDILKKECVNVSSVITDQSCGTGKAYVNVQGNGESSIVVYTGANDNLSRQDVTKWQHLFENVEFCLLQLEISTETVEYAASIAKQNNVKVVLKPSATQTISDYLLSHVDILIPNKSEFNSIQPGNQSLEEKAQYFLDKGVKNVIITMGHKGCYLKNKTDFIYFPAADFLPVDTTGAADAFIAALVVYLSNGFDLKVAIKYATYAAGTSVTRQGVQPALVDKATLEMHADDINNIGMEQLS